MKAESARDSMRALLKRVPAFELLDDSSLDRIMDSASPQIVPRGTVLIQEFTVAEVLYIVLTGRFVVLAGKTPIAEVGAGEPIGELAFFAGGKRTANVVAARNSEVLALTRESYDRLQAEVPQIANGIVTSVSRRLAANTRTSPRLRPRAGSTICVLPVGNGALDPAFIAGLTGELGKHTGWKLLSEDDLPADIKDTPSQVSRWLDQVEKTHGRLVLVSRDADASPVWHDAIATNSDTVFLAGALSRAKDAKVPVSDRERRVMAQTLPSSLNLVLWRAHMSDEISGSANWLAERTVALHHHVGLDSTTDFARLSRFIRGKAVGLVLCGGGSLGTAHIGAIKALLEHGYEFDMVGGTSIGSAMSGAYCLGLTPDRIMDLAEEIFVRSKALRRLAIPVHSILDQRKLDSELRKHYGPLNVEDAPLNFFAVTTSLTTNDTFVLRKGPMWRAVRASCSLPGILPPVVTEDGEVLIDGGLIDNVPISVMRNLKPGPNVVFNFDPPKPWTVSARYDDLPGRLGALAGLFRRGKDPEKAFPGIFNILTRAMIVNARRLLEQTRIGDDILFQISTLPGMSFMDWKQSRKLFNAAHDEMSEALARLEPVSGVLDDDQRFERLGQVSAMIATAQGSGRQE